MILNDIYHFFCADIRGSIHIAPTDSGWVYDHRILLLKARVLPSAPIAFSVYKGSRDKDVVNSGCVCIYIVSERFVAVWNEHGITGFSTFPVAIQDKQGRPVHGYHGLSITGRCGDIDYDKTKRIIRIHYGRSFEYYKGMYFDPATWDGSDVFGPETDGMFFVTTRVKAIMEAAGLTNIRFYKNDETEQVIRIISG